jgi:ABC-2 type transport system permease protein
MKIARQFLRLQRGSLIGWGLVTFLMAFTSGTAATTMQNSETAQALVRSLPPALQKLAGAAFIKGINPADAYLAMKWFLILPVMLGIFAAFTAAAIVARETERGTISYLLTLPIDRGAVIRERFIALAGALALLYLISGVGCWAGLKAVGLAGSPGRWALLSLGYWAINLGQAGLCLLLSLGLPSWTRAIRVGVGLVVAQFLVETGLQLADLPLIVRAPFLYGLADFVPPLQRGAFPWSAVLVGLALAAVTLVLAERRFVRQQLAV